VTEELDEKGQVRKRRQRHGRMMTRGGRLHGRSVQRNREGLSTEEGSGKESGVEETKSRKRTGSYPHKGEEIVLEEDLIKRFEYTLLGREMVHGRPAFVLRFKPRQNLPVKKIQDRVINRVSGKVWVDAEEFEIARLNFWLSGKVSFGMGLLGAMQELDIWIERVRLDAGVWLTGYTGGLINYRQLFNSRSIRWRERMSDFERVKK
jgi:hypothetical protein